MADPVRLSVYAAGFNYKYANDEVEVRAQLGEDNRGAAARRELRQVAPAWRPNPTGEREQLWQPNTTDFRAEAMRKPPAVGVASLAAFLAAIRAHQGLSIVEVYAYADAERIWFSSNGGLGVHTLKNLSDKETNVFASFAPGGAIHFYTSNAGLSDELLSMLAYKLGVRVVGYKGKVNWSLQFVGDVPKRTITGRGMSRQALPLSNPVDPPRRQPTVPART